MTNQNMVVTSQPQAAQAGIDMLKQGGNAVDAAIATAICLTVVEPCMNGIGSDAFAIVWDGKELQGLNASGPAPQAWTPEYFAEHKAMPTAGWDSVTVPGAVGAWSELSKRYGKLNFETLFKPAIDCAACGFEVTPIIADMWSNFSKLVDDNPDFQQAFLKNGKAPKTGETFSFPEQAKTLTEIANTHGESFYRGALAEAMIAHCKSQNGAMTLDDLANYQPQWVTPLEQEYRDVTMHELPPNNSGLIVLMSLGILQHFDLSDYAMDDAESVHLQVEALKLAYSDALYHVADDGHLQTTPDELLASTYLKHLAQCVDPEQAHYPKATLTKNKDTVYLTTADQNGMMVSFIQSNFMGFGSGVVVPGTGISLQNRGWGFSLEKGHPNQVGPGKRPYHTIIPGFITQQGKPLMSLGLVGGFMQPQGNLQLITRMIDYQQTPQQALDAPRWYFDPFSESLSFEQGFPEQTIEKLREKGHKIVASLPTELYGGGQIIYRQNDSYLGGCDPRKDSVIAKC